MNIQISSRAKRVIVGVAFVLILVAVPLTAYILNSTRNVTPKESEAGTSQAPERWFHPNYHYDFKHNFSGSEWGNYFKDPSFERDVVKNIDVMGLFILHVNRNEGQFLSNLMPILERNNKKLSVEAAVLNPVDSLPNGQEGYIDCRLSNRVELSTQSEIRMLKKIYAAGGKVDYLSLDDPIARGIKGSYYTSNYNDPNCGGTMDQSIDNVVKYIKEVKKLDPNIKVGLITNFPNWEYNGGPAYTNDLKFGDYKVALDKLMQRLNADPERPKIYFIHADNPYDYAKGYANTSKKNIDWTARVMSLERQAKSYGLEFGLIYNSQRGGEDKFSDKFFYTEVLSYIVDYKNAGGKPDNIIIESWYPRPKALLPATMPYTNSFTAIEGFKLAHEIYGFKSASTTNQIYKLTNSKGVNLYVASELEKFTAIRDNSYEYAGVPFNTYLTKKNTKLKPVYRLIREKPAAYLYTISEKERTSAIKTFDFKPEGIAFYAYWQPGAGLLPVHRLQKQGQYFYTTDKSEADRIVRDNGFKYEGIGFYVPMK